MRVITGLSSVFLCSFKDIIAPLCLSSTHDDLGRIQDSQLADKQGQQEGAAGNRGDTLEDELESAHVGPNDQALDRLWQILDGSDGL